MTYTNPLLLALTNERGTLDSDKIRNVAPGNVDDEMLKFYALDMLVQTNLDEDFIRLYLSELDMPQLFRNSNVPESVVEEFSEKITDKIITNAILNMDDMRDVMVDFSRSGYSKETYTKFFDMMVTKIDNLYIEDPSDHSVYKAGQSLQSALRIFFDHTHLSKEFVLRHIDDDLFSLVDLLRKRPDFNEYDLVNKMHKVDFDEALEWLDMLDDDMILFDNSSIEELEQFQKTYNTACTLVARVLEHKKSMVTGEILNRKEKAKND